MDFRFSQYAVNQLLENIQNPSQEFLEFRKQFFASRPEWLEEPETVEEETEEPEVQA